MSLKNKRNNTDLSNLGEIIAPSCIDTGGPKRRKGFYDALSAMIPGGSQNWGFKIQGGGVDFKNYK